MGYSLLPLLPRKPPPLFARKRASKGASMDKDIELLLLVRKGRVLIGCDARSLGAREEARHARPQSTPTDVGVADRGSVDPAASVDPDRTETDGLLGVAQQLCAPKV